MMTVLHFEAVMLGMDIEETTSVIIRSVTSDTHRSSNVIP